MYQQACQSLGVQKLQLKRRTLIYKTPLVPPFSLSYDYHCRLSNYEVTRVKLSENEPIEIREKYIYLTMEFDYKVI